MLDPFTFFLKGFVFVILGLVIVVSLVGSYWLIVQIWRDLVERGASEKCPWLVPHAWSTWSPDQETEKYGAHSQSRYCSRCGLIQRRSMNPAKFRLSD